MKLPYKHARMSIEREGIDFRYRSQRLEEPKPASLSAEWQLGKELGRAREGTIDFFLIERYMFYSTSKNSLFRCQVHHRPYELVEIKSPKVESSLIEAAVLAPRPWTHFIGSEGVDVEVFQLERVKD